MTCDDVITPLLERETSTIPLPALPPAAAVFEQVLGKSLPSHYWKFALLTRSHRHERSEDTDLLAPLIELVETFGNAAFAWSMRHYAIAIQKCGDTRRVADFGAPSPRFFEQLERDWMLKPSLILGKGEQKQRQLPVRNAFSRLFGVVAVHYGVDGLSTLLDRSIGDAWRHFATNTVDFKTALQEETQGRFRLHPVYTLAGASGPDHLKTFTCTVQVGQRSATGIGASKKAAEQEAARGLLAQIGVTVSAPNARAGPLFDPDDMAIADRQRPLIARAETVLDYSFRRPTLIASALTHRSFIHELPKAESERLRSYDVLACLGAEAVHVVALQYYLSRPQFWRTEHGPFDEPLNVSASVQAAVRTEFLATSDIASRLTPLLLVGRGQSGKITREMRSQIVQSTMAAILLDASDEGFERAILRASGAHAHVIGSLQAQPQSTNPELDRKTKLQEICQGLRWSFQYRLILEDGPEHRRRFKSSVALMWGAHRLEFPGGQESALRKSEDSAAAAALACIQAACSVAADAPSATEPHRQVCRRALESVSETLAGSIGWRRVLRPNLFGLRAILSTDARSRIAYLDSLHRRVLAVDATSVLPRLLDAFRTAPVPRRSTRAALLALVKQWAQTLRSITPDAVDDDGLIDLLAEMQLAIVSANAKAQSAAAHPEPLSDLIAALELTGCAIEPETATLASSNVSLQAGSIDLLTIVASHLRRWGSTTTFIIGDTAEVRIHSLAPRETSARLARVLTDAGLDCGEADDTIVVRLTAAPVVDDWIQNASSALGETLAVDRDQFRYVAQLLHDAKNSLIAARTSAALSKTDAHHRFAHLAAVETALARIARTCDEVVMLFGGPTSLTISTFPLRSFLTSVVTDTLQRLPSIIAVSWHLDRSDGHIAADRGAIQRALENMLKNAAEAMPRGGDLRIESIYDSSGGALMIEVTNSGAVPESVFAALQAGALPGSSRHEGAGLGLVTIDRIARLHGGTFTLRNVNGRAAATLEIATDLSFDSTEPSQPDTFDEGN